MPRNILFTGGKGSGKSTWVRRLMKELGGPWQGFFTLPYEIGGRRKGFYFHSLAPVAHWENDVPISVQTTASGAVAVTETFEGLGSACLRQAAAASFVVMDELGRLEGKAARFQRAVEAVLESDAWTICAVKKKKTPFLDRLRSREDILLLDLDETTEEMAKAAIQNYLQTYEGWNV
ncbi:hypothetical protein H9X85_07255 [Anaerotignum lactatifermentans]|uniref:AAA+ ATPase domain-containing protein n=1 Tax=Anaerotignum lactatifermentans TaxID=160404 RepID=A0ABS2G8I9_9FIRM|nr:nucleoside-triphosphatase [Anaerotignum lactatifermentans]MBM6829428.1 hypothetical protein [Anaerotignum lactatifermentans]MBM6877786.1 hypothetical protein [Anaerotignum lactatifermentans]MBM6951005.1 hypothetical protein [Anaerotignum lactatifermentans]